MILNMDFRQYLVVTLCIVYLCYVSGELTNKAYEEGLLMRTLFNTSALNETDVESFNHSASVCSCGPNSLGCYYLRGQKICSCYTSYAQKNGWCESCDCGMMSMSCSFEGEKKICSCYRGYAQEEFGKRECQRCDCGIHALSCKFDGFTKICSCYYGYDVSFGTCKKCDCGPFSISCDSFSDSTWKCSCMVGYEASRKSLWDSAEECKAISTSGWRSATYITTVLFLALIISLAIKISRKRRSSS